jgi:phage baseplate assembly protein W
LKPINNEESDLKKAMRIIAETQEGPKEQMPSMGCNIKWVK